MLNKNKALIGQIENQIQTLRTCQFKHSLAFIRMLFLGLGINYFTLLYHEEVDKAKFLTMYCLLVLVMYCIDKKIFENNYILHLNRNNADKLYALCKKLNIRYEANISDMYNSLNKKKSELQIPEKKFIFLCGSHPKLLDSSNPAKTPPIYRFFSQEGKGKYLTKLIFDYVDGQPGNYQTK